jgi:hypothetical protein
LFDARAGFVEGACEEGWLVLFVGLVGNDGSDAARSRGVPIGLAGVAFVADDSARLNVYPSGGGRLFNFDSEMMLRS